MLSVIVPVYNAELYLERCVNSILRQTYKSFELLLIDDGSTDSSGKICDKYKYDERVCVIHRENQGLVSARNEGITKANGEYICFVDADDWIDENFFAETFCRMTENSIDICIAGVKQNFPDGFEQFYYTPKDEMIYDGEEAFVEMFNRNIFSWELWGRCFKTKLLKYVKEDESIVQLEDLERSLHVVPFANKVLYTSKTFYHYYWRSSSMIHKEEKKYDSTYKVYSNILASRFGQNPTVRNLLVKAIYADFSNKIRVNLIDSIDGSVYTVMHYKHIFKLLFTKEEIEHLNVSSNNDVLISDWKKTKTKWQNLSQKIYELFENLSDCKRIFIYGTGYHAFVLASFMKTNNIDWNGFIISDNFDNHKDAFMGRNILKISDDIFNKNEDTLILAMNEKNCSIINEELRKRGWSGVLSLY